LFRSNNFLVLDEIERIPIHASDIRNMLQQWNIEEARKRLTPTVYASLT
jgi:FAD synthase